MTNIKKNALTLKGMNCLEAVRLLEVSKSSNLEQAFIEHYKNTKCKESFFKSLSRGLATLVRSNSRLSDVQYFSVVACVLIRGLNFSAGTTQELLGEFESCRYQLQTIVA